MLSDVLLVGWIISGSILSLILLVPTKNMVASMLFGFMLAPMLPIVIVCAIIKTYLEEDA